MPSVYGNLKVLRNTHVRETRRKNLLDSIGRGIVMSRACSWAPSQQVLDRVDKMQSNALRLMLNLHPDAGQSDKDFSLACNRAVGRLSKPAWSYWAARSFIAWASHLLRHPDSQTGRLGREHDYEWLQGRRASQTSTPHGVSRTNTRASTGKVYRWDNTGWITASGVTVSKDLKHQHAAALRFMRHFKVKEAKVLTATAFL